VIHYSLRCEAGHDFDGWFRSSADYEDQRAGDLLTCPLCGSRDISKALMAPAVQLAEDKPASATHDVALLGERERKIREMMRHIREEVTRNARDVGPQFADMARQMHEGEIERDSIYGRASADEVRSLAEDGVEFYPLPPIVDETN
jgi:hypothetical protein